MSLDEMAAALDDQSDPTTVVTSVRQPVGLRRALTLAVELGLIESASAAINRGLRVQLEAVLRHAALEQMFETHPELRPTLAETAIALAELDHDPLFDDPELIEQAAREIVAVRPGADADDVLIWAAGMKKHDVRPKRSA